MSCIPGIMDREIKNNPSIRGHIMGDLEESVSRVINAPFHHNASYGISDFNCGMLRAAGRDASVGGCATARRAGGALTGTPPGGTAPSDEWFRRRLAAVTTGVVEGVFAGAVLDMVRLLRRMDELPRDGLVVAVDLHKIPRYDRTRDEHLTISKYDRGTKYFERYITIHCVNDGLRLILGCLAVPAGASVPGMVRALIDQCMKDGIIIKLCLFDREFFSVQTVSALNELDVPYLMPCRNSPRVVETLNRFGDGPLPRDAVPCRLEGADGIAPYNMVMAVRRRREKGKSVSTAPEDRIIGFATNLPWVDVICYAVRWGIESAYAQIEAMRAKTRSRNPGARLFCFVYSLMVFNAWVMARILLRSSTIPGLSLSRRLGTITQLAFKEIIGALAGSGPGPPPGGEPGPA